MMCLGGGEVRCSDRRCRSPGGTRDPGLLRGASSIVLLVPYELYALRPFPTRVRTAWPLFIWKVRVALTVN
jgi:hypothetical protein